MIESVEAWLAVITGGLALIGIGIQLFRKIREAKDWREVAGVLAKGIEDVDREFKSIEPDLLKALDNRTAKRLQVLGAPKAIKRKTSNGLRIRPALRFNKLLNRMGYGPDRGGK